MHYRFCPLCGAEFDSEGGEPCHSCFEYIPPLSDNPKNPVIAVILTAFLPGLGQIYNGDSFVRGALFFICFTVGILFLIIPGILIWIYAIYDACITSNKINHGELAYREIDNRMIALFILLVIVVGACMIAFTLFMIGLTLSQGMGGLISPEMKQMLAILGYNKI